MTTDGARGEQTAEENPLRILADILGHHATKLPRPRPETDRRTNYRQAPVPPGVDLTATSIEDTIRRDPAVIEHAHEVAHATAPKHAAQRVSTPIDASTGREILDYLDAHRDTLPAELRKRIDATGGRLLRQALEASTRTRLVCPFCGGRTVVPTPDLRTLVCIDYACAPDRPRRIDPAYAQEPERRITTRQLALLAGGQEKEPAIRKQIWRAGIKPVHTGPHGKHEYRWADVAHLVAPKPKPAAPRPAPTASRDGRTGLVSGSIRSAAA